MRRHYHLSPHLFTTAPALFQMNLLVIEPLLRLHHPKRVEIVSLHLKTKELPQPVEAEAALASLATAQHHLVAEGAETLAMDWIVVQQCFKTRRTSNPLVPQRHHAGLQLLTDQHIVSLAKHLLTRRQIDTIFQVLPDVHPAEHLLMHFRIAIWCLQRHLLQVVPERFPMQLLIEQSRLDPVEHLHQLLSTAVICAPQVRLVVNLWRLLPISLLLEF